MAKTIETYKTYLDNLDKADPYAISKVIAFYKGLFSDCQDAKAKDEAFWMLRDFYEDVMVKARSYPAIKEYIDHLNNDRVPSSSITVHSAYYMTVGDVYVQDVPMPAHIKAIFNDNGFHLKISKTSL